jgi:hypothetical protein
LISSILLEQKKEMIAGFKKFRAFFRTLGILIIWVVLEGLLYAIFGKGTITTIIGIGIAFIMGAYFFHAAKKAWKNWVGMRPIILKIELCMFFKKRKLYIIEEDEEGFFMVKPKILF